MQRAAPFPLISLPSLPLALIVRSAAQVATTWASAGLQDSPVTLPLCPVSDMRRRPVDTSHTRTACTAARGGSGTGDAEAQRGAAGGEPTRAQPAASTLHACAALHVCSGLFGRRLPAAACCRTLLFSAASTSFESEVKATAFTPSNTPWMHEGWGCAAGWSLAHQGQGAHNNAAASTRAAA